MLLHLSPTLLCESQDVVLVDVHVLPFGLRLIGGVDVVARRPYPNKRYRVACRKVGRKAVRGFLVATPAPLRTWTVVTRWALDAERLLTHTVRYELLDGDFDAASDSMMLWHGADAELGGWSDRIPSCHAGKGTMHVEPRMGMSPADRYETFRLPTLEPARLVRSALNDRLPRLADAFRLRRTSPFDGRHE